MRLRFLSLFLMSSLFIGGATPFVYAVDGEDENVTEDYSADPDAGESTTFVDTDTNDELSSTSPDVESTVIESESESESISDHMSDLPERKTPDVSAQRNRPKGPAGRKPPTRRGEKTGPKTYTEEQVNPTLSLPNALHQEINRGGFTLKHVEQNPSVNTDTPKQQPSIQDQVTAQLSRLKKITPPTAPNPSESTPLPPPVDIAPALATLMAKDQQKSPEPKPITPVQPVQLRPTPKSSPSSFEGMKSSTEKPEWMKNRKKTGENPSSPSPLNESTNLPPQTDFRNTLKSRTPVSPQKEIQEAPQKTDFRGNLKSVARPLTPVTAVPPVTVPPPVTLKPTEKLSSPRTVSSSLPTPVHVSENRVHGGIQALEMEMQKPQPHVDHLLDILMDKDGKGKHIPYSAPTKEELSIVHKALKIIAKAKNPVAIKGIFTPLVSETLEQPYKDHLWVVYGALLKLKTPNAEASELRAKIKTLFHEDKDELWDRVQDIIMVSPSA